MGEPTLEIQGKRVNARVGFRWEEWHHIAGTYDGDEQRIYVDGLPRGEVLRWKSQAMPNTSDLTIGKHRAGPGLETILFHMDDIMMFSRALSADEIQALFKLQGGVRATGKVTAGSPIYAADQFVDPGSLKVKFLKEESAKLLPKGFKWIPGDSNNTPFAVMETDDPTDVVRAKPVYFDQKTGGEIHYSVQSEKPLTKLVYTGFAFREFFIEIHNEDGSLLASAGPYNLGNTEQTIEIPLPNITRFEVVLKTKSSAWVLIKRISFEPATSAPPKAAKPTPLAQPAPTAKATPTPTTTGTPTPADRIRKLKQQLEQGQINKDEYDRRVKEILDAI